MATEIIRQGTAPVREPLRPLRSRAIDRLRAFGAKGMRMAGSVHRELQEDLGGDDTRVDGKRVRAPVWLFIACILGAAEVGRLENELGHLIRDLDTKTSSESTVRAKDIEAVEKALAAALVEQRRGIDNELADLKRQALDDREISQHLRERLVKRHIID